MDTLFGTLDAPVRIEGPREAPINRLAKLLRSGWIITRRSPVTDRRTRFLGYTSLSVLLNTNTKEIISFYH